MKGEISFERVACNANYIFYIAMSILIVHGSLLKLDKELFPYIIHRNNLLMILEIPVDFYSQSVIIIHHSCRTSTNW